MKKPVKIVKTDTTIDQEAARDIARDIMRDIDDIKATHDSSQDHTDQE